MFGPVITHEAHVAFAAASEQTRHSRAIRHHRSTPLPQLTGARSVRLACMHFLTQHAADVCIGSVAERSNSCCKH